MSELERFEGYFSDYELKALELANYADALFLDRIRTKFKEAGQRETVYSFGISKEIAPNSELVDKFINKMMNPPTNIFVSIASASQEAEEVRGNGTGLLIIVTSREVETEYMIECVPNKNEMLAWKESRRVYGQREYDRTGMLFADSAYIEQVGKPVSLKEEEFELLYDVCMEMVEVDSESL